MQYSNKHLIEVNCSFQFPQETTPWDSTFFGRFYENIRSEGFIEKEERKGVQLTFGMQKNMLVVPNTQVEDQVIFKDAKGRAILMSKNKISFHIIRDYTIWDNFLNQFIKPFSEIYQKLELGHGIRECTLVYLNRFNKKKSEFPLSDYFTIVSAHNIDLGTEISNNVQKVINNGSNLLVAKFNSQLQNDAYNIHLECGAVNTDMNTKTDSDWIKQANDTHAPVNAFFESIITDKLRNLIKK